MMKRFIISLIAMFCCTSMYGQHVTRNYDNVTMSEALRDLNELSPDYTISFMYNELEDFRVTTNIKHKSVTDAIMQVIGFYPVRAVKRGEHELYVECTHKTDRHLTGTVIDEQGQPVAYANIAVLNPADSTLLCGGVSNNSGVFVIPIEQTNILARISYIGYKTIYKQCNTTDLGTIRMQPETTALKGITVKGERIVSGTENGHLIYNLPMLLQIYPADDAYEALTRIPGVIESEGNLTFSGRPVTLIINGKATTLDADIVIERLKTMPSAMLAKAEVMPSAPAKYHVRGMAINIVTKDFAGTNQLSGQLQGTWRQHKYGMGKIGGSFIYNHDKFGMDVSYTFTDGISYGKVEHEANHLLNNKRIPYNDETCFKSEGPTHEYRIGIDYAFAENNRLNIAYTGEWDKSSSTNTTTGTANTIQHSHEHEYLHNVDASYITPFGLQLSASYTNYQKPRTQDLDGTMYDQTRNLFVDSRQKVGKWLFTADQTHQLPNDGELMYGVKAQFTNNNSFQITLDEQRQPIDDATSYVDYNERILNAYAGFSKQIGQSFSLDASLTAEQYHATKWNEWRFYPQFNAMWNINPQNMLNLSFSSETIYPTYWSTMSSIYYSSAYSEIWGNPDLKTASSYNLDLMWQLNRKYTLTAFAQFEPDYFVQLAYQPSDRMAVIMKETNFDYSNNFGLQASAQFHIGRWLNGIVNATGIYRHDKSNDFFDLPFNRTQLSSILSGTVVVKLSQLHNIQFIINPFFQSKAIQGVYDIDPMFRLHATLRWTSDNGKWSLIAKGTNILNGHSTVHSTLANQDYTMRVWNTNTPNVMLTAIYRIGNFKEKKKKEVDTSRMGY